ncbi:MAG TPA: HAMP domain-containing sensor histidine kinase [Chthoniobacteraceae bacterium]|jgi:signal transduction histidine kinase|nr:HAMP domain-containing sensor histidine kinase [Chthoniobacteraceae bacterium]
MLSSSPRSLWIQIAWPFLLFVLAGSMALAFWMRRLDQRESRAVFTALATTNASFLGSRQIPASEQMMQYLGRLLNMEAFLSRDANYFLGGGAELIPAPSPALQPYRAHLQALPAGRPPVRFGKEFEAVAAQVNPGVRLVLVRRAESMPAVARGVETGSVLAAFCLASVWLAWVVSRNVVHPLRLLTERLPHIEHDREATLPGAERRDEIGQLARAYLSARTQLNQEREQRRLAERMALLGRMATSLAHEIHNPLTAIRMHAQLIESTPDATIAGAAREALPIILAETVRIEGIVNQWMFLAKPEPPRTKECALQAVLQRVIAGYAALAEHAGVTLQTQVDPALRVQADERRLSQAFANLLINAVQAMPKGGTVEITARKAGGKVHLAFHDHGGGFSAAALTRGRELFYSEKEGGMGIGLTVTTEIVAALGGGLRLANAPDGGALATLTLPSL